jgi:hypothetical protein
LSTPASFFASSSMFVFVAPSGWTVKSMKIGALGGARVAGSAPLLLSLLPPQPAASSANSAARRTGKTRRSFTERGILAPRLDNFTQP